MAFSRIDRVTERISKISAYGASCLIVPWVVVFMLYIILRDFFHTSWLFVEEYTGYWMVIVTCLAMGYTLRRGEHIRIDTAVKLLPKRVRNILDVVAVLIALVASCVFVKYGVNHLLYGIKEGTHSVGGAHTLLWPIYLWIPIGYGFLSLELLVCLYHAIVAVRKDLGKAQK